MSSSLSADRSVTVVGLGPMGRALAGAFLAAGVRTTVWNRTPGRDTELVAEGRTRRPPPRRRSPRAG